MRVIAGSARHLALKTPEDMATRPTTDRIKETLFNMLQNQIPNCRFLDLFSGSGAIGIEAASRGAAEVVLVENRREALACIRYNLQFTKLEQRARLLPVDVLRAIAMLEGEKPFDVIFMDPPYRTGLDLQVLQALSSSRLLSAETLLIVEASLDTDLTEACQYGYTLEKQKQYKTNQHYFFSPANRQTIPEREV